MPFYQRETKRASRRAGPILNHKQTHTSHAGIGQCPLSVPAPLRPRCLRLRIALGRRRFARSPAARIRLVPTATIWAAPCATRSASHTATAPPPPRCGGSRTAPGGPGRRRTARSSAARAMPRLKPLTPVQAALCATRPSSHTSTAALPPPYCGARTEPASGRRRTARSLPARVGLVPSARRSSVDRALRRADGESHGDRPAPTRTRIWRAAQSARAAADRAQLGCSPLPRARLPRCKARSALRGRRVTPGPPRSRPHVADRARRQADGGTRAA